MAAAATAGDQVLKVELARTNDAPLRLPPLTEVLELSDHIHVLRDGALVSSLAASEATEPLLHELMVGRERSADFYHEDRQLDVSGACRLG